MRTAPAQPRQDRDQEKRWERGTVWSLASKASTDWWKTSRDRSTRTPGGGKSGELSATVAPGVAEVRPGAPPLT